MATETALQTTKSQAVVPSETEWGTIMHMAEVLVDSGMLPDSIRKPEAAAAIILKGRELDIPAMQAFSHIHVIRGKPSCSSELQLALLARAGVKWEWIKNGDDGVEAAIKLMRPGYADCIGTFSMAQAKRAGLVKSDGGWSKYPGNLLRARAISNGARMIGPDLLCGMSYTPEELGADVGEDGEIIVDAEPAPASAPVVDEDIHDLDIELPLDAQRWSELIDKLSRSPEEADRSAVAAWMKSEGSRVPDDRREEIKQAYKRSLAASAALEDENGRNGHSESAALPQEATTSHESAPQPRGAEKETRVELEGGESQERSQGNLGRPEGMSGKACFYEDRIKHLWSKNEHEVALKTWEQAMSDNQLDDEVKGYLHDLTERLTKNVQGTPDPA